ncbi:unnamed protein product, partial [Effrenium voratum]
QDGAVLRARGVGVAHRPHVRPGGAGGLELRRPADGVLGQQAVRASLQRQGPQRLGAHSQHSAHREVRFPRVQAHPHRRGGVGGSLVQVRHSGFLPQHRAASVRVRSTRLRRKSTLRQSEGSRLTKLPGTGGCVCLKKQRLG